MQRKNALRDAAGSARVAAAVVVAIHASASIGPASAVPLDAATCEKARAEQVEIYGDVPRLMERGATWAKQNATAEQMKRVARWIELEEQLQFRCGQVKLSPGATAAAAAAEAMDAPPPPADGAATATGKSPGAAVAAGSGEVTAKPKPKPRPKPDASAQAGAGQPAPQAAGGDAPPKPRKPAAKPAAPSAAPSSEQGAAASATSAQPSGAAAGTRP